MSLVARLVLSVVIALSLLVTARADSAYILIPGWPQLPEGRTLGAVSGVSVDSHGDVVVFRRGSLAWPASDVLETKPITETAVWIFDANTGARVAEWGANQFAMPHGLTVDSHDNVWLTDVALHQVFKFTHDGKPLLTLGDRGVAGNDSKHFNRPTKVAVAADGSFYVTDGYRNTRVAKFAPDGKFLEQWGVPGSGPGEFNTPHGIALDAQGNVYVCDRGNSRVQVFTPDGTFLRQWKSDALGRPYDIAIANDGSVFVADGGDQPDAPLDRSALVVLRTDGSVVERIGRWGNYDGQFMVAHAVAIGHDGAIYVGDITGKRVQKFVKAALERTKRER